MITKAFKSLLSSKRVFLTVVLFKINMFIGIFITFIISDIFLFFKTLIFILIIFILQGIFKRIDNFFIFIIILMKVLNSIFKFINIFIIINGFLSILLIDLHQLLINIFINNGFGLFMIIITIEINNLIKTQFLLHLLINGINDRRNDIQILIRILLINHHTQHINILFIHLHLHLNIHFIDILLFVIKRLSLC